MIQVSNIFNCANKKIFSHCTQYSVPEALTGDQICISEALDNFRKMNITVNARTYVQFRTVGGKTELCILPEKI